MWIGSSMVIGIFFFRSLGCSQNANGETRWNILLEYGFKQDQSLIRIGPTN